MAISFDEAASTFLPFGKFKGKTIAEAAAEDRGIGYLEWMQTLKDLRAPLPEALTVYLNGIK